MSYIEDKVSEEPNIHVAQIENVVIVGEPRIDPRQDGQSKEGQPEEKASNPARDGSNKLVFNCRKRSKDQEKRAESLEHQEDCMQFKHIHLFCRQYIKILCLQDYQVDEERGCESSQENQTSLGRPAAHEVYILVLLELYQGNDFRSHPPIKRKILHCSVC